MEPRSQRRIPGLLYFMLVALVSTPDWVAAQFQPAAIFSDHMVLQRDREIPVWGVATPGENVVVFFNGSNYSTGTGTDGYWEILLPPMVAGGPFQMKIVGESGTREYVDILVGDVWLCSGQSNMEWVLANTLNAEAVIRNGNHPRIRHFKVPHASAFSPEETLPGGEWQKATPKTVGGFTAIGYYFAKYIEQKEAVPIGLLNSSWGGSRIEPWMDAEALGYTNPARVAEEQKEKRGAAQDAFMEFLRSKLDTIPIADRGMRGEDAVWARKETDENSWEEMELPNLWEQAGWEGTDGVFWFRKTIPLGKGMQIQDATLSLGPIDDNDQTWFNGHPIGATDQYNTNRVYRVPSKYLMEGANSITIRVTDTGGGGGIYGDPEQLYLEAGNKTILLAGKWKYKVGMVHPGPISHDDNQQPTLLYNKMIHPILKFPIKGVLWYQGESNAGNPKDAGEYAELFKSLITSWRKLFQGGDFPFLYVQLANYMEARKQPEPSNWALLRESQGKALELPNTGQAVIIDIGEAGDIHPRNKEDVGMRLALAAEHIVYGRDVEFSGPVLRNMQKQGARIVLQFDHIGGGLVAKNSEPLKGFSLAGKNGHFVWANAVIKGDKIEVSAAEIADPVAVRYAWADNPEGANLYNKEGLPAGPFRTDTWAE